MKRGELKDPRKTFGEALLALAERRPEIVVLSADSSSGSGLSPFKKRFPERHLEFGIMEQGVIGFAAGLATTGKIPFVAAIAPFLTSRPFEMVRNDLGYMRQNVKVVGRSAGLTYSDLGPTHQSIDDVALLRTIPGMVVLAPGDPVELVKAVEAAADHVGPVYLRVGSPPIPVLYDSEADCPFRIGAGITLTEGREVTLIGTGAALPRAFEAAKALQAEGIGVRLISLPTLKPLDRELLLRAARETGRIVTVEEHYVTGGLGSAVAELLVRELPVPMRMVGVNDRFPPSGPYEDVLRDNGLQPDQIAAVVREFVTAAGSKVKARTGARRSETAGRHRTGAAR
jgi:transketolase